MIHLAALAVFSGLSLNLLLQFAIGTIGAARDLLPKAQTQRLIPFFQFAVMFVSVLSLWMFFNYALPPYWRGFSEYFLLFPFSALVCMALERLGQMLFPMQWGKRKIFSAITGYDGLVPASLLITLILAGSFSGALVLALFFALGNIAAMLALNEIRRKSTLERVPRYLRGSPLVLISMGLLSLVTGAAAGICFKILNAF